MGEEAPLLHDCLAFWGGGWGGEPRSPAPATFTLESSEHKCDWFLQPLPVAVSPQSVQLGP